MAYDGKLKFDTGVNTDGFNLGLDSISSLAEKGLGLLSKSFTATFESIKKAGSGIWDFMSDSVSVGANFESSISNTMGLMSSKYKQGTDEYAQALDTLSTKAQDLGASTQFSASQVSDAFGYMALAGWDVDQQVGAIDGVLNLATSSGMELANASDMVTDYLSAFSMEADQAGYFADMLAYASTNSNTSVESLGEAYKNCAANMNASGQSVETTTALLSKMADQVEKGSTAGTKLTAIMRDLKNSAEDGAIAIGDTSVAVYDSQGQMRDLGEIMVDIQKATNGMTNEQRDLALGSSFTADSIAGVNLVLNAGADSVVEFSNQLKGCGGTAEEVAKTMNDNLNGDITSMQSALEGLQIALSESLNNDLRTIVQNATKYLSELRKAFLDGGWENLGKSIATILTDGIKDSKNMVSKYITLGTRVVTAITGDISEHSEYIAKSLASIISQAVTSGGGIYSSVYVVGLELITGIAESIANNSDKMVTSLMSNIMLIVDAISTNAPVLLQAGLTIIQAILNGISKNSIYITETAINLLTSLINIIDENIYMIEYTAVSIITGIVRGIIENLPMLLESALQLVMNLAQYIVDDLPLLIDCAIKILSMLATFIIDNAQMLLDCALQIIMQLVEYLLDESNLNRLVDGATEIITSLIAFIVNNLPLLIDCAIQIIEGLCGYIFNNLDKLGESAVEILTALATGLVMAVYLLTDAVAKLIADVCIKFDETDWGEVGHNIINGVADGFRNGFEKVKETFTGVWEELKKNFCNLWDINSPSKVMADLTEFLPKGMSVGFKSGIPDTLNSFNSGMNNLSNGLNTDGITQKFKSVELSGIDFENIYSKMQGLNYSQSVPSYSNVVQSAYKSNGGTSKQTENNDNQKMVYDVQFTEDDHLRLKNALDHIKGKFVLSYNDDEFIRELYKDYTIINVSRQNNLSTGTYKEAIIKNF